MSNDCLVKPTHILIYADGACLGNPGPGGYAANIRWMSGKSEFRKATVKGGCQHTTNSRMEMLAAIKALDALGADDLPVILRSESTFLVKGASFWAATWEKNNWRKADKKQVANVELWQALMAQVKSREVTFEWVKGHSGEAGNDEVDALAREQATAARNIHPQKAEA